MGIMREEIFEQPLTHYALQRVKLKEAEETVPKFTCNLGSLLLPNEVIPTLQKIEGQENSYRIQAEFPADGIHVRPPYERIPTISLSSLSSPTQQKIEPPVWDGFRPRYLRVKPFPEGVKLEFFERSKPPADFDYLRDGRPVKRPTNVFLPDDRSIYNDTSFPWSTVGRVDTPLGYCSGCTIGPRLLLTAGHMIQWNADGTAGWVRFRPAYYNGSAPFGEAWATNTICWVKVYGSDGLTDSETAFDYVVCVLDTRIGDVVGYPSYRTYSSSWNGGNYWQHMGYPSDLTGGERPAFQGDCVISTTSSHSAAGQTGYVLGHFNDVVGGHSGGPIWGWWSGEDGPRVVGTQSSEASVPAYNTSGDNEFGGGPALSELISWARSNYP